MEISVIETEYGRTLAVDAIDEKILETVDELSDEQIQLYQLLQCAHTRATAATEMGISRTRLNNIYNSQGLKQVRLLQQQRQSILAGTTREKLNVYLASIVNRCMEAEEVVVKGEIVPGEFTFNAQGALKAIEQMSKLNGLIQSGAGGNQRKQPLLEDKSSEKPVLDVSGLDDTERLQLKKLLQKASS